MPDSPTSPLSLADLERMEKVAREAVRPRDMDESSVGWGQSLKAEGVFKATFDPPTALAVLAEAHRARALEERVRELEGALKPFAALADAFGTRSMVEVCLPNPRNPSTIIRPIATQCFRRAQAVLSKEAK